MERPRVLLVDDEVNALSVLSAILEAQGFSVSLAQSVDEAAEELARRDDVQAIVSDFRMPEKDGLVLLEHVKAEYPHIPFILLTAYGSVDSAVQAVRDGAYYYLVKPPDYDFLVSLIKRAIQEQQQRGQALRLQQALHRSRPFHNLIGQSAEMRRVFRLIREVAGTNANVLILGESGTGKELVARAIHASSPRAGNPFVAINCAAIPEALLESELFGYERGAFTGAVTARPGRLEQANGGTLFLDEVGDMPLALQAKMLRVLQERVFERLGGNRSIRCDFRLITATNKDLAALVEQGGFRQDLYYRINVFPIRIPPLRERTNDIPLLATHFLERFSQTTGKRLKGIAPEALGALMAHSWPGNVRELENVMERAVILANGEYLRLEDLPRSLAQTHRHWRRDLQHKSLAQLEKEAILETLRKTGGNKSQAARLLGISRKVLYARLQEYGYHPDSVSFGNNVRNTQRPVD